MIKVKGEGGAKGHLLAGEKGDKRSKKKGY